MWNLGLKPQIYGMSIPKSRDLGRNFGDHCFENFHEKMKSPKSIQDHSGMVPGAPGYQKNFQKSSNLPLGRPWGFRKKSEKIIRKHRSERLFGPIFSNFPMLAHVLSLRGDSRAFLLLKTLNLGYLDDFKSDSWSR